MLVGFLLAGILSVVVLLEGGNLSFPHVELIWEGAMILHDLDLIVTIGLETNEGSVIHVDVGGQCLLRKPSPVVFCRLSQNFRN